MTVDKLVDSTQLDTDLTSVANAIRTKGGTSASLAFPADFVSAIAAIPSGGGASFGTGTITPTSDITTCQIDTGGSYDRFVMYRHNQGNTSVRSLRVLICDFSDTNPVRLLLSTNNSGSGAIVEVSNGTTGASKSGNVITYDKSNDKMVSGLLYRWVAW